MVSEQEIQRQVIELTRGCEAAYTPTELHQALVRSYQSGKPLRIKMGLDPTAPDIHLGHTVVLRVVRKFQDLGHKAVIIIGDYTARIGDPSGQNKTRPELSAEQIAVNAATYIAQAGKVLDTSPDKLEMRPNSEWLGKLDFAAVLNLTRQMTVARMMERDTFELRYKAGIPIGVHEFLYPLIQGYDSVCVQADVEMGGSDQTFNCLVGRGLQENAGQRPQVVMIMPILVGLDGTEKMSKSKGNYIGVAEGPGEMFGKVMSIPDGLMRNYFTLLTTLPSERIDELVDPRRTHPRQAKVALGKMVVEQFHDAALAQAAAEEFDRVFSNKQAPTDMPAVKVPAASMNVIDLIMAAQFAATKSEARRLVGQGAVSLDEQKLTDLDAPVALTDGAVLKVGKRRFGKISVSSIDAPRPSREKQFDEAMMDIYRRALTEADYKATRFLRMLLDHRGLETAHMLLATPDVSEGYTALFERRRLDLTVEALVIKKRWRDLFTESEVCVARSRLSARGYQFGDDDL